MSVQRVLLLEDLATIAWYLEHGDMSQWSAHAFAEEARVRCVAAWLRGV